MIWNQWNRFFSNTVFLYFKLNQRSGACKIAVQTQLHNINTWNACLKYVGITTISNANELALWVSNENGLVKPCGNPESDIAKGRYNERITKKEPSKRHLTANSRRTRAYKKKWREVTVRVQNRVNWWHFVDAPCFYAVGKIVNQVSSKWVRKRIWIIVWYYILGKLKYWVNKTW